MLFEVYIFQRKERLTQPRSNSSSSFAPVGGKMSDPGNEAAFNSVFFLNFSYDDEAERITQYERITLEDLEKIEIGEPFQSYLLSFRILFNRHSLHVNIWGQEWDRNFNLSPTPLPPHTNRPRDTNILRCPPPPPRLKLIKIKKVKNIR